ncbi:MAG: hypothetical protein LBT02_01795 [Rickettsiales bacterium]|nr:hypothetical protein [Rickettsiales bacterium]
MEDIEEFRKNRGDVEGGDFERILDDKVIYNDDYLNFIESNRSGIGGEKKILENKLLLREEKKRQKE